MDEIRCLIVPGLGGSSAVHWQSRWEATRAGFRRVEQDDWDDPEPVAWSARLEESVTATGGRWRWSRTASVAMR